MSSYLNIYLIDRKTKEKKYLRCYGRSSEIYRVIDETLNPPSANVLKSGEIHPTENYLDLTLESIERCIDELNKNINNYKQVIDKSIKAKKNAEELFIKTLIEKNLSISEIKEALIDFEYDDDYDEDFINELEDAKNDLGFLCSLLYDWYEDTPFCGLAVNIV